VFINLNLGENYVERNTMAGVLDERVMMNITITGASGFLSQKLAYGLLSASELTDKAGSPSRVEHLTLLDVENPSKKFSNDPRVTFLTGYIKDRLLLEKAISVSTDSISNFMAIVSSGAEKYFDLGMSKNLDSTRAILALVLQSSPPSMCHTPH
jgi:nucleoside-diphosphate-sugar epimerase